FKVGDSESKKQDVLGRVYKYFIAKFASAEGKNAGEFYTPASIVKLHVEMIEPYESRIYDPCYGSGGMFVQSERFVERHQRRYGYPPDLQKMAVEQVVEQAELMAGNL
ncbi:TPA: N-6 DNA methylase, partial [Staphylococcus aureus]|nr:N-6 DNA methylase [Staphylococcus aureus]